MLGTPLFVAEVGVSHVLVEISLIVYVKKRTRYATQSREGEAAEATLTYRPYLTPD